MEKIEWLKIAGTLNNAFAQKKFLSTAEEVNTWYELLKDLPTEQVQANAYKQMMTNKFPPSIADLRESPLEEDDWTKGWEEIQKAIRNYGAWQKSKALESLSPRTRLIAERFGWDDFCNSENQDVLKAQFRDAFNENAKREKQEIKIPTEMRIERKDVKRLQD